MAEIVTLDEFIELCRNGASDDWSEFVYYVPAWEDVHLDDWGEFISLPENALLYSCTEAESPFRYTVISGEQPEYEDVDYIVMYVRKSSFGEPVAHRLYVKVK